MKYFRTFRPLKLWLSTSVIALACVAYPALADNREVFALKADEQQWVREYMRQMLETVTLIQGDLAAEKPGAIAARVSALNTFQAETKPKGIGRSFPQGFRTMAQSMDQQWQTLAASDSSAEALKNSHMLLNYCNACHRSYRLTVRE